VGTTPGALLSSNSLPNNPCSRLICALTAVWVNPSAWAALVKPRKSTTATKVRSNSVGILVMLLEIGSTYGTDPPRQRIG